MNENVENEQKPLEEIHGTNIGNDKVQIFITQATIKLGDHDDSEG